MRAARIVLSEVLVSVETMTVVLRGKRVWGELKKGDKVKFAAEPFFYKAKSEIVGLEEEEERVRITLTLPNKDMAPLAEMVFLEGREYTTVEE
jgi:hypothetical protein